jgi:anaerobic magnesium-protoporphyrin IX monomethyl ester cyclase
MSKNRIILFHPKTLHEKNYRYFHIPYSILSLASVIDRKSYELVLIDNNLVNTENYETLIKQEGKDLLCVGISAMIGHQIHDGLKFSRAVRKYNNKIPIIWGGPLPTLLPKVTIENENIDIIVRGQGEVTFYELVEALRFMKPLSSILGISYKSANGEIIHNADRPFSSLKQFPPYRSSYDLINVNKYLRFDEHINTRTVSYHSSQGCPFNCGFCCEVALWKRKWSGFQPNEVLSDIEFLIKKFSINGIKFYDSEFFIDNNRAFAIINGMIERQFHINWYASIHPINLAKYTNKQLELLKLSGVSRLLIGAESGVQDELNLIAKGTDKAMLLNLAKKCSDFGIVGSFTFITGYPESPSSNIETTLDFARSILDVNKNHECKIHFYAPFPGTPLYKYAINNGFIPPKSLEEWSMYDYYNIVTPWVEKKYEKIVRNFNENSYPYLHPLTNN